MYFRKSHIAFPDKPLSEAEAPLLEKVSKVIYLFDFHQTIGWILPKERHFAGKKIGENEYVLSRYRHMIWSLVPRVVARVRFQQVGIGSAVKIKTRLNVNGTIAFVLLTLGLLSPFIRAIIRAEMPEWDDFSLELACAYGYFLTAIYYEARVTEKTILDVIKRAEIRSIFSA